MLEARPGAIIGVSFDNRLHDDILERDGDAPDVALAVMENQIKLA